MLLGPQGLTGKKLELDSARQAMSGANQFAIEQWPDGGRYVTGYARSDGYRNFAGLGWIVLVRQNADLALAPATKLQRQTLLVSLGLACLAALLAWIMSGRIAAPLLRLTQSADALREGRLVGIPKVREYAEVESLSNSLATLVSELKSRQSALENLNQSLETQVAQRTADLAGQNAALELARAQAEEATAAKSRFLAAASHDLRQPLHAMTLFARALSRRVCGAEAPQLVSQLETSLASLKDMFDALLNVSRLDAGLIQPNLVRISVADLVERITEGFRAEAEARGLQYRTRSIDATIVTDPALLETMLRNLVSNALKFTRVGGVLLAVRRHKEGVLFEVYDTGPGIAAHRQARIYEEFERSKEQATGSNEGLGLGLSIVRRYAKLLGIKVRMASKAGRGTHFTLVVTERHPAELAAARPSSATPVEGPPTLAGRTVLIVDDDHQIVDAMKRELADRGCHPLSYSTVADAKAALMEGRRFDVAIVDFDLGDGQTGPTLLEEIEQRRGEPIRALILTGGTDAATLAAVMGTGRPWLTKPAEPDDVADALSKLMAAASTN